jgi:Spy/CpxP family protein refolding chaperone
MRTKFAVVPCLVVLASMLASGQASPTPPSKAPDAPGGQVRMERRGGNIMFRREMGKWWKNSETAQKLQLTDNQIQQLDQVFYEHRLKLIDYGANMEKEDLKLQTLLDADVPNEGQVGTQVDQVLAARGKLEREYTMMNLDLRKVLSIEQWRQLKSIREQRGGPGDRIMFFQKRLPGPGGPGGPGLEMPPEPLPPPPPGLDE